MISTRVLSGSMPSTKRIPSCVFEYVLSFFAVGGPDDLIDAHSIGLASPARRVCA
ncbi:hypothetical protein [Rhodococcus sp. IEGM 1379]|uniref:hypothetical protein n=1 Tax=Rhodococcus sp. IEGM 1379 TaxID=3047086 RepID=UPI0024B860DE|nr:hypothetical protein [Rhodococcus sp. IEGM 1379]MDI9917745.1 hypothetical protein [Rhodococcus sp. IEGM 1379]